MYREDTWQAKSEIVLQVKYRELNKSNQTLEDKVAVVVVVVAVFVVVVVVAAYV